VTKESNQCNNDLLGERNELSFSRAK